MKYVKPLSLYQDLQKLHPSKRGRLLGLSVSADYFWEYSVGVAVSDANNQVSSPYCVMKRKIDGESNRMFNRMFASRFQDLINKHSVSGIIVGQRKDPREIKMTSRNLIRRFEFTGDPSGKFEVKKFVDYLTRTWKLELVPYAYWEEEYLLHKRYEYMMCGLERPELDIKNAASGTLQRYLHAMNNYPTTDQQESAHDHLQI